MLLDCHICEIGRMTLTIDLHGLMDSISLCSHTPVSFDNIMMSPVKTITVSSCYIYEQFTVYLLKLALGVDQINALTTVINDFKLDQHETKKN